MRSTVEGRFRAASPLHQPAAGPPPRERGGPNGFTLVEVMVAMAVLGLAVLALIRLGAANAGTAGSVETAMLGDIVAENAVVDALTAPLPPAFGTTSGTIVNAGRNWQVTREVAVTENPALIRISIDVRDASGSFAGGLTAFRAAERRTTS